MLQNSCVSLKRNNFICYLQLKLQFLWDFNFYAVWSRSRTHWNQGVHPSGRIVWDLWVRRARYSRKIIEMWIYAKLENSFYFYIVKLWRYLKSRIVRGSKPWTRLLYICYHEYFSQKLSTFYLLFIDVWLFAFTLLVYNQKDV